MLNLLDPKSSFNDPEKRTKQQRKLKLQLARSITIHQKEEDEEKDNESLAIKVYKDGKEKLKKVERDRDAIMKKLRNLSNKNTCFDIF